MFIFLIDVICFILESMVYVEFEWWFCKKFKLLDYEGFFSFYVGLCEDVFCYLIYGLLWCGLS